MNQNSEKIRLDVAVSSKFDISRSLATKYIHSSHVTVGNKVITTPSYKLYEDENIVLNIPEPTESTIQPENLPLEIIYEDDDLLIINKQQGMLVHPTQNERTGTLVNALLFRGAKLSTIGGVYRPGIVHRLDKDTSGLIIVAKNDKAHQNISRQIEEKTACREYIAIIHGRLKENNIVVEVPIGRDPKTRVKMAVVKNGRYAKTEFAMKNELNKYSLINAKLYTGRTHQIRVHLKYLGIGIVGDEVYGNTKEKVKTNGQLLHAYKINFNHPKDGRFMEFQTDIPPHFKNFLIMVGENDIT